MAEQPKGPGFGVEKHPQERKREPKIKILILEDQFAEQAKQGLSLPCFEVKVVKSIEELKNLDPQEFQPDIVILDIEVPKKEGETPVDTSKVSKAIVQEKFGNPPIFYYTSVFHGGRQVGGVGELPSLARTGKVGLSGVLREEKIDELIKKYRELSGLPDKSKPGNWLLVFQILPVINTSLEFLDKLRSFHFLPEEIRDKMMEMLEIANPALAEAVKRTWKYEAEKAKKGG